MTMMSWTYNGSEYDLGESTHKDVYGFVDDKVPENLTKDIISNRAFAEMDKNEDGEITESEFVQSCLG